MYICIYTFIFICVYVHMYIRFSICIHFSGHLRICMKKAVELQDLSNRVLGP